MSNARLVVQLTSANLMIGGIALLGWTAVGLMIAFDKQPQNWQRLRGLSDAVFAAVLVCGPLCLAAGIGLWRHSRWGRSLALALGAISGALAVAGVALACANVFRAEHPTDYVLCLLFLGYCGATFAVLWKHPYATPDSAAPK